MFNIATLVHGEEALLAVGFIFTFHFFNGHLRPEKFPMDTVIFSGVIPEHELKEERPVEYAAPAARRARWRRRRRRRRRRDRSGSATTSAAPRWSLGVITVFFIVYSLLL